MDDAEADAAAVETVPDDASAEMHEEAGDEDGDRSVQFEGEPCAFKIEGEEIDMDVVTVIVE